MRRGRSGGGFKVGAGHGAGGDDVSPQNLPASLLTHSTHILQNGPQQCACAHSRALEQYTSKGPWLLSSYQRLVLLLVKPLALAHELRGLLGVGVYPPGKKVLRLEVWQRRGELGPWS